MDQWLLGQSGVWVYITLFLLLMGGAIGLPIPEDIPVLLAGILVHQERARLDVVFPVAYTAIVLGDLLIYSVGRTLGTSMTKKGWLRMRLSESQLRRVKYNLDKRSLIMIFVARHLFYVRTLTFLSCGALKMNIWRFLISDMAAALISVPLVLGLGYFASEHYDAAVALLKQAKAWSLVLVVVIVIALIFYARRKGLFKKIAGDESEDPPVS